MSSNILDLFIQRMYLCSVLILALENDLNVLMPKIFSLAREDTEHSVVIACLETLQDLLEKLKLSAIYGGNLESICDLIKDAFSNKVMILMCY